MQKVYVVLLTAFDPYSDSYPLIQQIFTSEQLAKEYIQKQDKWSTLQSWDYEVWNVQDKIDN